jgi:geranylgeranyl reductase family protein
MKYDVLIVGGGPAGSMAAIQLMGSGLRVAILDRAQFPRLKPCGGGISCRAYTRFAKLAHVLKSVPTNLVHKLVFESPSGDAVEFSGDGPLYAMIRRLEFDNALLDHCKAGGIEVREDVTVSRVEVGSDGVRLTSSASEEFFADLVIGTDGVNSTVAVQTGMRGPWRHNQIAIDGTEESPRTKLGVNQDTMYVYYGYGGAYGYGYLFPKVSHVNVGVGYFLEYYKRDVSQKPYLQHLEFLDHLKATAVLSGQSQRENFHAYVLPVAGPLERISRDRILLAGDAAGFVNGFTAEGIYYAMVSGEHAGLTALAAVRSRNVTAEFLRRHDRACEAEIGHELRKSITLQKRLFVNPALIDSVVRFAKRNAAARNLLARFGVGEISYEELKWRTIKEALPGYLRYQFEKAWQRAARFSGAALQTRRS